MPTRVRSLPVAMHTSAVWLKRSGRASGRVIARRKLLGGGLILFLALVALSTYNAITSDRIVVDLPITRWVQRVSVDRSLERALFFLGLEGMAGGVLALVLAWQWLWGHRTDAVLLLLTLVPISFNSALRALYQRDRPQEAGLVYVNGGPEGYSYPSGLAVLVVLLYGFLLYLLPRYTHSKRLIYGGWALFVLFVAFTGLGLIYRGRHWPSDVFGGYLYGLLFLLIWIWLHRRVTAWSQRHPGLLTLATLRRLTARQIMTGAKVNGLVGMPAYQRNAVMEAQAAASGRLKQEHRVIHVTDMMGAVSQLSEDGRRIRWKTWP